MPDTACLDLVIHGAALEQRALEMLEDGHKLFIYAAPPCAHASDQECKDCGGAGMLNMC